MGSIQPDSHWEHLGSSLVNIVCAMFEKMYKPLQWKLSCSHTTNLINADDQMLLIIRIIMPYN